jgi:hypothetical protein
MTGFKFFKRALVIILFIVGLFLFAEKCSAQKTDTITTYSIAPVDEDGQQGISGKDTIEWYFIDGASQSEMKVEAAGENNDFEFDVDSVLLSAKDSVYHYIGVVGTYHNDERNIKNCRILVVSGLHKEFYRIYLFINQNTYVFFN